MEIKKKINGKTWIEIISALFILLFVYTGISKFQEIDSLEYALRDYPFIGNYSIFISWALPSIELLVAALLLIPRLRLMGLYGSLVLMSSFTLYLIIMFSFTNASPCTCGGMLQKLSWPQHLIFNVIMVILSIIGIRLFMKNKRSIMDGVDMKRFNPSL